MRYLVALVLMLLPQVVAANMSPTEQQMKIYDCQAGDQDACNTLLVTGSPFDFYWFPNPEQLGQIPDMIAVRRDGCAQDGSQTCIELGLLLLKQDPADIAESYGLFAKACDVGNSFGCAYLSPLSEALTYGEHRGMDAVYDDAAAACAAGDQTGCTTQARLNAQLPTVIPDRTIWYDQMVTACEAKNGRACTLLSYMLSSDGVYEYEQIDADFDNKRRANRRAAAEYGAQACAYGNPVGCWNIGISYGDGEGVRADWETAQSFYVRACNGGYRYACEELNYETFWQPNDPIRDLRGPCDRGDFTACLYIAQQEFAPILYGPQDGADGERMQRFHEELRNICGMGSTQACAFAGVYLRGVGRVDDAQRFATAACNLLEMNGCTVLANILKLDRATPATLSQSIAFYDMACQEREWGACNNLGDSYEHGRGVPVDKARAARLYALACENGKDIGCRNLDQLQAANP